jgi:hypothetical protein
MKIRPVGVELFPADQQTGGHDITNISVFAVLRKHLKTEHVNESGNIVQRPGPPPSAEVKKEWLYSFTPPYVFVTCTCSSLETFVMFSDRWDVSLVHRNNSSKEDLFKIKIFTTW